MKLPNWLCLSNLFRKNILPHEFEAEEPILRTIYHPFNLKNDKVRDNLYKPPTYRNDVSVNRLKYTTETFCKKLGKHFANADKDRNYFGFSCLKSLIVTDHTFSLKYTPIIDSSPKNPYHADILIGYKVEPNTPLPAELSYKIKSMTSKSRIFKDDNPDSDFWIGEKIKYD